MGNIYIYFSHLSKRCDALTLGASNPIRVPCVTCATSAVPTVVSSTAISILSTVTWISTLLIATGKVIRTVIIYQTFVRLAVHKGVALVVLWTVALSPMVSGPA